jgi:hypothetical protein
VRFLRITCAAGLLFPFLLLLATRAHADTEIPLFTARRDACDFKATSTAEWRTIIFRITPHPGASRTCVATERDTLGLISLAFATLSMKQMDTEGAIYQSIFLGRLTDYEWFSRHLSEHAEAMPVVGGKGQGEKRRAGRAYVRRPENRPILDPIDAN